MIREDARDPLVEALNERAAQLVEENAILRAAFAHLLEDNKRLVDGKCDAD